MQGLSVTKAAYIIESALSCVIGHMQTDTPVETEHKEIEVVTQADTRTQRHLTIEPVELKGRSIHSGIGGGIPLVLLHGPHISSIEEDGTIQSIEQSGAVFKVPQQLHITVLEQIREASLLHRLEVTRPDTSHGEGTDAVGASHTEHLAERCFSTVAIGIDHSSIEMSHQLRGTTQSPMLGEIGLYLHKLRIRIVEHLLVLGIPFLTESHIGQ